MAEETSPEEGAAKSSKISPKLLIIIVVIVLLLAGGGGAAWFLLGGEPDVETDPAKAVVVRKEAIYVKLRTLGGKPSFIANFSEKTGRQRFLQIYAEAMTRDQEVADALTKHMPLVIHELSTLYASQEFVDLQTAEGKERLRKASGRKVQEILQREINRPGIEEVFFTNFVMQ
ncbi:MAG: flagellar basal body-associated FliL family protein [Halopseudomonas sp.]